MIGVDVGGTFTDVVAIRNGVVEVTKVPTSSSVLNPVPALFARSRIEILFGRLKDWRRVATRYDRCPTAFFSAVALAATVIFWL